MNAPLDRLFQHVAWADQETLRALEQASGPHPDAYKRLAHLLAAEHIWLSRIQSENSGGFPVWSALSAAECRDLSAHTLAGYRALLESTSEDQLLALVSYRNAKGIEFQTPLVDILLHVALHGAYHRGQIASALRQAGLEPTNTDFITFSRLGPLNPETA